MSLNKRRVPERRSQSWYISQGLRVQLAQLYCSFGSRYILYVEIESMAVSPEALNEIQAALKQAKEGQLVQACHNLMAALTRHHLLRSSVLLPDEVACHPENRDGFGLSGHDVHALLHGLSEVGWDSRETNPICSEVGPNHAEVLSFNQELVRSSGGLLPDLVPTSMRYASLAGSHTNAALRALRHEVKLPRDHGSGPLALEGKLSMARA